MTDEKSKRGRQVTANYRYRGAWNEINVRITERQNLFQIYAYLISPTLFATFVEIGDRPYWRVVYLVPLISLLFAYLLRAHEKQIDNLVSYLAVLELIDNPIGEESSIPSYHADNGEVLDNRWKTRFLKHRYVNILGAVGLITVSNSLGLVFSFIHSDSFTSRDVRLLPLMLIVCIYSITIASEPWFSNESDSKRQKEDRK